MQRLTVSANRRFLILADGSPFFWLADTAWELIHRCDRRALAEYLDNRKQLGFNVVMTNVLPEFDGLHTPNPYGQVPFIDDDPLQPVEAYFQYMDEVLTAAAERGLYVGLLPAWGDKITPDWGTGPVIFNPLNARAYGEWLGTRCRHRSNIVWILGGDRPPAKGDVDWLPIWRALAEGIRAGAGDEVLMSFHPPGGAAGTGALHDQAWLDFHMLQSGHVPRDSVTWDMLTALYQLQPPKPVLDAEPNYEDHPVDPYLRTWQPAYGCYSDYDVRKQAYRAVFAGACGHTYGHHSVWQFYDLDRVPVNYPQTTWRLALNRPGAAQMRHLKHLMLARPFLSRIPDQRIVTSAVGTRGAHIRATRDAGGQYALVYIPQAAHTITVDLTCLASGAARAYWYDPREGTSVDLGLVQGQAVFTTPDTGPDWVLVLDDSNSPFDAPGPAAVRRDYTGGTGF